MSTLSAAFGVIPAGSFPQGQVESVEQTATHAIWDGIATPLLLNSGLALDNGDRFTPLPGSLSVAEFTGGGSAIVIANEGRTIINGFIADNAADIEAMVQLAENEIRFLLPPRIDCNENVTADDCDIAWGTCLDTNLNGVPDDCETDCNLNGIRDTLDLDNGTSEDCSFNGIPDECEPDCDADGIPDVCDLTTELSADCNTNGVEDECDIVTGGLEDWALRQNSWVESGGTSSAGSPRPLPWASSPPR